ncbi:hypothetical protein BH09PAT2_BH09PAT2_02470 [soil metagenome]
MKAIIPMAGRGSRFAHIDLPKPLIPVLDKTMLAWSLESIFYSFPRLRTKEFIFIALREHEEKYHIREEIQKMIGIDFTIRYLDEVTDGPVSTVLTLDDMMDPEEDFFTIDCDQYIRCRGLRHTIEEAQENKWAGLIPTFEASDPAYSYVKLDRKKNIVRTAEKEVISSHAAVGIYYFGSWTIFADAAKEMIAQDTRTKNEFYMSPLYNKIIEKGGIVRIVPTEKWMTMGTPEDEKRFITAMSQ